MKTTIQDIRKSNEGKFADVSKLPNGKYVGFHSGNAVTGMCKIKKECIADLQDMGYTYTTEYTQTF